MSDPRPRPQYGEYASPEDQAKAMGIAAERHDGVSPETEHPAPAQGQTVTSPHGAAEQAPGASARVAPSWTGSTAASASQKTATVADAGRPRRRWDVILTAVLLGLGFASVMSSYSQYANFPATLDTVVGSMGYGGYGATGLASAIGIALNSAQIVIFAIAAVVAIRLVRRGRIGFYVPLAGAVVFVVVAVVLMFVALNGDPALMAELQSR